MTFASIPPGTSVFLDANPLIYHFSAEPQYGAACTQLLRQIEQHHLHGAISTHVMADVAHRLMTLEAMQTFGWPPSSLAARLRKRHNDIPNLKVHRQAVGDIRTLGIQVLPITHQLVEDAIQLSDRHELLVGDALILATMQAHGLTHLASNDSDFDRVPGITRYSAV
jgi:predicted nucleic acid-binding protein